MHDAVAMKKTNHLISLMPEAARAAMFNAGEEVPLTLGTVLLQAGSIVRQVYFPLSGYISVLSDGKGAPPIELGMAGVEGAFGAGVLLGVSRSSTTALVQGDGTALSVPAAAFIKAAHTYPQIAQMIYRYLHVLLAQVGQNAACNRSHTVEARLARWLLMSQDRARAPTFTVTHEFLSMMLGVRRAGITHAAHGFRTKGIIHYERGVVTIVDRPALESSACACYAVTRNEYRRTMALAPKRQTR